DVDAAVSQFDMTFFIGESPQGLTGYVEYCTDLFDASTMERLLRHLTNLLRDGVRDPDVRVRRMRLMSPEESQRAGAEWNDTDASYPTRATIHGLIEEQARRRPKAI